MLVRYPALARFLWAKASFINFSGGFSLETNNYDAIIIGSGMGGLTSGALLAKTGMKVLVLEQHYEVGGCASMFRRKNFHFDAAIHLISGCQPGGELYQLYDKLGIRDRIDFIEVDPMYTLRVGNSTYEIPANLDHFQQKLMKWFPEDQFAIFETMEEIKQIGKALHEGNFQKNPNILKRVIELNS